MRSPVIIAFIFIFLCVQIHSIVIKANFWKTFSYQTQDSVLSDGMDDPPLIPACIADTHSGFSSDAASEMDMSFFFPVSAIRMLLPFEKLSVDLPYSVSVLTKYIKSIIAIQTVK